MRKLPDPPLTGGRALISGSSRCPCSIVRILYAALRGKGQGDGQLATRDGHCARRRVGALAPRSVKADHARGEERRKTRSAARQNAAQASPNCDADRRLRRAGLARGNSPKFRRGPAEESCVSRHRRTETRRCAPGDESRSSPARMAAALPGRAADAKVAIINGADSGIGRAVAARSRANARHRHPSLCEHGDAERTKAIAKPRRSAILITGELRKEFCEAAGKGIRHVGRLDASQQCRREAYRKVFATSARAASEPFQTNIFSLFS